MKIANGILAGVMALGLMLVGCNKSATVDTAQLESSFKGAEASVQGSVDKAIAAVKAADYKGALTELQSLAKNAALTPEQQQAVQNVVAQVQQALTGAVSKGASDLDKAAGDVQKSLPK